MNTNILDSIFEKKIIAIVRGVDKSKVTRTVEALIKGGISNVEIAFDMSSAEGYKNTLDCLYSIKTQFVDTVALGVGTVLTPLAVCDAVKCGAEYIISPNLDREVIEKTKELGKKSIPGAFTPSEIVSAYKLGADIVKIFPAGNLGAGYIKAVLSPLRHIPVAAVGGITPDNISSFLAAGVKAFGIGGNLVNLKAINENNFDEITSTAAIFCSKMN